MGLGLRPSSGSALLAFVWLGPSALVGIPHDRREPQDASVASDPYEARSASPTRSPRQARVHCAFSTRSNPSKLATHTTPHTLACIVNP